MGSTDRLAGKYEPTVLRFSSRHRMGQTAKAGDRRAAARARRWGLVTLIAALSGTSPAGCGASPFGSKGCSTAGCGDQFTATVAAASSAIPPGIHTIDVTADGAALSCTFTIPPATSATGGAVNAECQVGLQVVVGPATICATTRTDGALIQSCEPVSGQLTEYIIVKGTPASVRVEQSVGGTVIFDQSSTPMYQKNQPNGPGCEPICQQAGVEWTIP